MWQGVQKQAFEIGSFRAACYTTEVGYCSLEHREIPKLSRSDTRDLHFGWMIVRVGFKDDRLERILLRTPSLQGPCDRSLKSEVPCGSCLNWR